jgi:hypothetical protein
MKVTGNMEKKMVLEKLFTIINRVIKGIGVKEKNMEQENILMLQDPFIKAIGRMDKNMAQKQHNAILINQYM